jgi:hypothetical protein
LFFSWMISESEEDPPTFVEASASVAPESFSI